MMGTTMLPFACRYRSVFLAEQLGVQRATISEALAELQDKKMIRHSYRQVVLSNMRALEKLSCECFPTVKATIDDV
jgi:DNA-binding transcriptional regulator YhcF (GntR family)